MGYLVIELLQHETVCTRFRASGRKVVFDHADRLPGKNRSDFPAFFATVAAARRDDDTIILALAPSYFSSRGVTLPLTDRRKIREVLSLELKGETACDTDELIFDSILRRNGSQVAVWGRKHELAAQIELLAGLGLEPQILTASLFHWHHLLPEEAEGQTWLMADSSGAAVISGGEPLLFRTCWGEEPCVEIAQTVTALELAEGVTLDRISLFGSLAGEESCETLRDRITSLPVSAELDSVFSGDHRAAVEHAGAYSLVKAVRARDIVNFRHGELACTSGSQRSMKRLRVPTILAALLVAILFGDLGMRWYFEKRDLDSLDRSIGQIYREIFPNRKKPVDEVGEVKSEIRRLSGAGTGIEALSILKKMAGIKGDDISGFYEAEIEGNQVRLKGDARSIQAVTDLKNRAGTALSGVEVGEIKSRPDGTVSFSLRGTIREEGK